MIDGANSVSLCPCPWRGRGGGGPGGPLAKQRACLLGTGREERTGDAGPLTEGRHGGWLQEAPSGYPVQPTALPRCDKGRGGRKASLLPGLAIPAQNRQLDSTHVSALPASQQYLAVERTRPPWI